MNYLECKIPEKEAKEQKVDKKNKDCIVAIIKDREMINKISEIIEDYYIAGQYSLFVENLANLLGNKKESKKLSYEK